mmetsp:Transcript_42697/g.106265  ORF Transcript_42697/g.106265 Transcript_42697/m.106265 type:complete len:645 (-) Transcript_42697:500-2434(-)
MDIPIDPRAELHKKGEAYARQVARGLPRSRCQPFARLKAPLSSPLIVEYADKSFWELWSRGRIFQFFLLQWALQHGTPHLRDVSKFVIRIEMLPRDPSPVDRESVAGALSVGEGVAVEIMDELLEVTRALPHDASEFLRVLAPLLAEVPAADISCKSFFDTPGWAAHLANVDHIICQKKSISNFVKPIIIGVGGYSIVQLAFENTWGIPLALKRLPVHHVVKKRSMHKIHLEKRIAMEVLSPFIVNASYAFMDQKDFVLALRMMPGGALSYYIRSARKAAKLAYEAPCPDLKVVQSCLGLGRAAVKFYVASTVLALEALHNAGFVYRDLKDKNIVLDASGHARLSDFGLSHDISTGRASGRAGTWGFWAPEQLGDKHDEYGTSVDFWTLGACAYHWATCEKPFHGDSAPEDILRGAYDTSELPQFDITEGETHIPYLKELCEGLMTVDPARRLGCGPGGIEELKRHPFFEGLSWTKLHCRQIKPPIQPNAREITADLPSVIKADFERRNSVVNLQEVCERFPTWDGSPARAVVETTAVEWLDKDPLFFHSREEREAYIEPLTIPFIWSSTIVPPHTTVRRSSMLSSARSFDLDIIEDSLSTGSDACTLTHSKDSSHTKNATLSKDATEIVPPKGKGGGCCCIIA